MRKSLIPIIISSSALLLSACTTTNHTQSGASDAGKINRNLSQEHWTQTTNMKPDSWTASSDSWYKKPTINISDGKNKPKNYTVMSVDVPNFTQIDTNGNFVVQIVGGQDHTSVQLAGANEAVKNININADHGELSLSSKPVKTKDKDSRKSETTIPVIIRVGVVNLSNVTNKGAGLIEGKFISSHSLTVNNSGAGDIILDGNMILTNVSASGKGDTSIIGVSSKNVKIKNTGNGSINLAGRIGVDTITHKGNGNIRVIGIDSDQLNINTEGKGDIILSGYANLKTINYKGDGNIYFYWVDSKNIRINADGSGIIGLAGSTEKLYGTLKGSVQLQAKYLKSDYADIQTYDHAHANVNVSEQLFAAAEDHSSIYFFNAPSKLSKYQSGSGLIIPLWK